MIMKELVVLRENKKVFHADGTPDNNLQPVDTGTVDVGRLAVGGYRITVSHVRNNPGMSHRHTREFGWIINLLDVSDEDAELMAESILVDYLTLYPEREEDAFARIRTKLGANKQHKDRARSHAAKAGFDLKFPGE